MAILRVGLPMNTVDINARSGTLYIQLRDVLTQIENFQAIMLTITDADLQAADQNGKAFTAAEVTQFRSAMVDLTKFAGIFKGTQTQATTYDFRTFAKSLAGGA